jgi:hypothetical protein
VHDDIDSRRERSQSGQRERFSVQDHLLALIPLATCLGVAAVVLVIELL